MAANSPNFVFERVLAAVGECLDRPSAEALIRVRADQQMQEWIEKLADKSTEGMLTPERDEYEALVRVGKFVAILRRRDNSENLASACYHCNLHKGPNLSGIDQESGALVRLFNPREPL